HEQLLEFDVIIDDIQTSIHRPVFLQYAHQLLEIFQSRSNHNFRVSVNFPTDESFEEKREVEQVAEFSHNFAKSRSVLLWGFRAHSGRKMRRTSSD
ncbi:hypothetical protein PENTCL1PPCAC_5858, partial [Pristionchus entomophagus]